MRSIASSVLLLVALAAGARAQTDVVVGVPIRDGKAGAPRAGVIVDTAPRDPWRTPTPVVVPEAGPGTTTVRPQFGGGYVIENASGSKTAVRPRFGGGTTVERDGRVTTEVKPVFGGGATIERSPGSPVVVVPVPVGDGGPPR